MPSEIDSALTQIRAAEIDLLTQGKKIPFRREWFFALHKRLQYLNTLYTTQVVAAYKAEYEKLSRQLLGYSQEINRLVASEPYTLALTPPPKEKPYLSAANHERITSLLLKFPFVPDSSSEQNGNRVSFLSFLNFFDLVPNPTSDGKPRFKKA